MPASRYRPYYPRDQAPTLDGDPGFVRVNAKASPELLQQGELAAATNVRLRSGVAETRPGTETPRFGRVTGFPLSTPTKVFGWGRFSDPNGVEWMLVATDTGVWRVREGRSAARIAVPETLTAADKIDFVQAFNTVLLFRGAARVPWQWDGDPLHAFVPIDQTTDTETTEPIPNGSDRFGLVPVLMNGRLIVPFNRNAIAISDLLDYTEYDEAFAEFDLTTGNDDTLTCLYPFSRTALLCFKDQSIALVDGLTGDLSQIQLQIVNREIGCIAGKTAAMVGGDVLFLSATGVFRIQQVVQERLQTAAVAVSDPIQAVIDRIHWPAAGKACAIAHGDYYYLAVPIDGSLVNNAVLPFNTVSSAWEGIHTWPAGTQIDELMVTDFVDRKHPYALDLNASRVLRLYIGYSDVLDDTEHEIAWSITSRGYLCGENLAKMYRRAAIACETWNPAFTVDLLTDGVNESKRVKTVTKSRTRYFSFDTRPWNPTNENDDHSKPRREDYSLALSTPWQLMSGVVLNFFQSFQERAVLGRRGRWAQVRMDGTQGSVRVTSLQLEAEPTQRAMRNAA